MRRSALLLTSFATLLVSCGPKALTLPEDIVERAATCGVVAAAQARATSPVQGALGFDQQMTVMHYPMLVGAESKSFSREQASAAIQRMQAIQEQVINGKWQTLVEPCKQAYPDADPAKPVNLPSDVYQAQIGCYSLANFVANALKAQGATYDEKLISFGEMQAKLDPKIAVGMASHGVKSDDAKKAARNEALSKAVKWGSPGKVMESCRVKFT